MAGLAGLVFSVHYFLLSAVPGALSEILNGTRTLLSNHTKSEKTTRILAFSFLGIYIALLCLVSG